MKKRVLIVCLALLVLTGCNAKESKLKKELLVQLDGNKQVLVESSQKLLAAGDSIKKEGGTITATSQEYTIKLDELKACLQASEILKQEANSIVETLSGSKTLLDAYKGQNDDLLHLKDRAAKIVEWRDGIVKDADTLIAYYNSIIPIFEKTVYYLTLFEDVQSRGILGDDGVYYYQQGSKDMELFTTYKQNANDAVDEMNGILNNENAALGSISGKYPALKNNVDDYISSLEKLKK